MTVPAQISTLDREISAITEKLRPPSREEVSECIAVMLKFGMIFPTGIQPNRGPEVYAFALQRVSGNALSAVTEKLIAGELPRAYPALIPAPPELAVLVRDEMRQLHADLRRCQERRQTLIEIQARHNRPKASEESNRRCRELVKQLRNNFAKQASKSESG